MNARDLVVGSVSILVVGMALGLAIEASPKPVTDVQIRQGLALCDDLHGHALVSYYDMEHRRVKSITCHTRTDSIKVVGK